MTLSMSINANQSSVLPFQSKPMAISSITSPPNASLATTSPLAGSSSSSSSSSSSDISSPPNTSDSKITNSPSPSHFPNYHHSSNPSSPESIHSTTETETFSLCRKSSSSSQPMSYVQYHRGHHPLYHNQASNYTTLPQTDYSYRSSSSVLPPLSLQERRQRNKAASAKYRAKKNQQQGEMRTLISSLTKENELLQRQVDHVRHENNRLKATCDHLRGKMLAEKMLKKLLQDGEQVKEDEMERFDEDIDFEDDEEDELLWKQRHDTN